MNGIEFSSPNTVNNGIGETLQTVTERSATTDKPVTISTAENLPFNVESGQPDIRINSIAPDSINGQATASFSYLGQAQGRVGFQFGDSNKMILEAMNGFTEKIALQIDNVEILEVGKDNVANKVSVNGKFSVSEVMDSTWHNSEPLPRPLVWNQANGEFEKSSNCFISGFANTTDATPTLIYQLNMPYGTAAYIKFQLLAVDSTGLVKSFDVMATAANVGGVVKNIPKNGDPADGCNILGIEAETALLPLAVNAGIAGSAYQILITGLAGKTINWYMHGSILFALQPA